MQNISDDGETIEFCSEAFCHGEFKSVIEGHPCPEVVKRVIAEGCPVKDDELGVLRRLLELKELYLDDTEVSGDGLVHLRGLKTLRVLSLSGMWDTGTLDFDGFENLRCLTALECLFLDGQVLYPWPVFLRYFEAVQRRFLGNSWAVLSWGQ